MSEYITFVLTKDTGKTRAYDVVSKRNGDTLAVVKWYGPGQSEVRCLRVSSPRFPHFCLVNSA